MADAPRVTIQSDGSARNTVILTDDGRQLSDVKEMGLMATSDAPFLAVQLTLWMPKVDVKNATVIKTEFTCPHCYESLEHICSSGSISGP